MKEETFVPSSQVETIWKECVRSVTDQNDLPAWKACLNDMEAVAIDGNTLRIKTGARSRDMLIEDTELGSAITRELTRALLHITKRSFQLEWNSGEPTRSDIPKRLSDIMLEPSPGPDASVEPPMDTGLNPKYTFQTFVEGSSNQLAYAAAKSVSENPARSYNPLFIYGGVGLGKTHLMQSIGHGILQRNPNARIVYVSSETFTNDLIESLSSKSTAVFRDKYRTVDVLLIDDIQFLIGKERTQEEFFHTFNNLHAGDRQIVITSDRPPHELHPLEDRLRSRFTQGLIADIQTPDVETREAILRKKVAEQFQVKVGHDVIRFIAERFPNSIRELEGAMVRVIAYSSTHGLPIEMNAATEALQQILPDIKSRTITIRTIQQKVCDHFHIKHEELIGERRDRRFAFPRQVAMFLSRELTSSSLKQIADLFGGRDHTTVIHAIRQIENGLSDPSTRENVNYIREQLKEFTG